MFKEVDRNFKLYYSTDGARDKGVALLEDIFQQPFNYYSQHSQRTSYDMDPKDHWGTMESSIPGDDSFRGTSYVSFPNDSAGADVIVVGEDYAEKALAPKGEMPKKKGKIVTVKIGWAPDVLAEFKEDKVKVQVHSDKEIPNEVIHSAAEVSWYPRSILEAGALKFPETSVLGKTGALIDYNLGMIHIVRNGRIVNRVPVDPTAMAIQLASPGSEDPRR